VVVAPRLARAVLAATVSILSVSLVGTAHADESTHILVGLTPADDFDVTAGGSDVEGTPFTSDSLGVLSFSFDDPGLPPGSLLVTVGPPGQPVPLQISGPSVTAVTESTAVVGWTTNRPSDALVEYGTTDVYGSSEFVGSPLTTSHSIQLSGLDPSTLYHFRVTSIDAGGLGATSADETFQTLDPPPPPLTVTDAAVVGGDTTWVRVVWTTNRPASSWVQFGTTVSYGSQTDVDETPTTEHDVTVSGLSPGTLYHLRAWSVDSGQDSASSGDLTFETPLPPPPPLSIGDVEVVAADTSSARLTWTTNRPSSSLVEYGETEAYGSSTDLDATPVTSHDMVVTDLTPGTTYHARVRSDDGGGDVVFSGDVVFETDLVPLAIADVAVEETGTSWAVIIWSTNRPASSVVEYGETDEYGSTVSSAEAVTEHSVTVDELEGETVYHFRVRSVEGAGSEAISDDGTFETMTTGPMGGPIITDVTSEPLTTTSVAVTWTTDRPATSQVVYGSGDSLDCATAVMVELRTDHRVVVGPIVPRLEYTFVARSACGCDTSSCAAQTFQTGPPLYGIVKSIGPRLVSSGRVVATDTTAVVRWATDRPCTTWIEWGADSSYGNSTPGSEAWRKTAFVYAAFLDGLDSAASYHYRVVAVGARGDTTTSGDQLFRTGAGVDGPGGSEDPDDPDDPEGPDDPEEPEVPDTEAPPAPTDLLAQVSGRDIELVWTGVDAPDVAGYQVYRTRLGDGAERERLTDGVVPGCRYLDRLVPEGAYAYVVAAVDSSDNESGGSDAATVELDFSADHQLLLRAYPNPTPGDVRFAFAAPPQADGAVLRVYSIDGRLVREIRADVVRGAPAELRWDGRDARGVPAASGVYLCEVHAGDVATRQKLTVIR